MLSCIHQTDDKQLLGMSVIPVTDTYLQSHSHNQQQQQQQQQQSGVSLYNTQNDLLLHKVLKFYNEDGNMEKMLAIINGDTKISLRIMDWFATNYAKKHYTVYDLQNASKRFKVYVDYKLKLRAYSKNDLTRFVDGIE